LRAASITRSRVSSAMLDPGVKARETADCDTPASAATSKEVARDRLILVGMPASSQRRILRIQRLPATRSSPQVPESCLNSAAASIGFITRLCP
jgi:hypothetical protein